MDLDMDGSRWSNDPQDFLLPKDSLVSDSVDDTYNVKLEKETSYKKHHFVAGTEYIKRDLHDVVTYNNGIKEEQPDFVNSQIFSAYLQDDYSLYSNQIITASVKYNHYDAASDKAARVFDTMQYRVGYIAATHSNVFKIFASQMELPTEQYVLDSTGQTNIELLTIRDYSAEYIKTFQAHKIGLCYEYLENENPALTREKGAPKYFGNHSVSVKYEYNFDPFNSLKSMFYFNHYHDRITTLKERARGGFVRLLNSWKKFDFYNEADYYHLENSSINGVGFNTGVRYKATPSLIFTLKGTNIFDTLAESEYQYMDVQGYTAEMKSLYVPAVDQSFTIGLEYDF